MKLLGDLICPSAQMRVWNSDRDSLVLSVRRFCEFSKQQSHIPLALVLIVILGFPIFFLLVGSLFPKETKSDSNQLDNQETTQHRDKFTDEDDGESEVLWDDETVDQDTDVVTETETGMV